MANCDILSFDMCTLESSQESLFFFKTESEVTFSQKVELTPNAGQTPPLTPAPPRTERHALVVAVESLGEMGR